MMASLVRRSFILALAVILLISCSAGPGFHVLKHELTVRQFPGDSPQTQSMAVVTGTATNSGNAPVRGCLVTITFYDSAKNKLGVATASKDSLEPGEVWNFSAQITGPDAWKTRSYDITPSIK